MSEIELRLERKHQAAPPALGRILLTPPINENYWAYRVRLTDTQAVVGFPKFDTIGIGFAIEEDWNTNLPHTCDAVEIFEHIEHNMGDEAITREACIAAIQLIQVAIAQDLTATQPFTPEQELFG